MENNKNSIFPEDDDLNPHDKNANTKSGLLDTSSDDEMDDNMGGFGIEDMGSTVNPADQTTMFLNKSNLKSMNMGDQTVMEAGGNKSNMNDSSYFD